MSKTIRIGAGAAWWGDRVEPAQWNAERGDLDYLCFETMAEATVSAAQVRARRDPSFEGYDTYLDDRMRAVLPGCIRNGTKIISNQGWINPEAAAKRVLHWLREMLGRPRRFPDLRKAFLPFGVLMHVGIQSMLYVAWFTPLMIASYAAFLAPDEAQRLGAWLRRRGRGERADAS